MKKVMLLCGSPHPEGNTAQVVEECANAIRNQGLLPARLSKKNS